MRTQKHNTHCSPGQVRINYSGRGCAWTSAIVMLSIIYAHLPGGRILINHPEPLSAGWHTSSPHLAFLWCHLAKTWTLAAMLSFGDQVLCHCGQAENGIVTAHYNFHSSHLAAPGSKSVLHERKSQVPGRWVGGYFWGRFLLSF